MNDLLKIMMRNLREYGKLFYIHEKFEYVYIYIMDGKLFYIVGTKKFKLMRLTIFNTIIYFLIYIYTAIRSLYVKYYASRDRCFDSVLSVPLF